MSHPVPVGDPGEAFRASVLVTLPTRERIAAGVEHIPRMQAPRLSRHGRRYELPRWFLVVSPGTVRLTCRLTTPKEHWGHTDGVDEVTADGPRRGRVSDFSRKSRARMTDTFRSLDYSPLFEDGDFPALVTLTMPGSGWEELLPNPRAFKRKVERFQAEYSRQWGRRISGVWKMEFQERGAPHLHILMTPPRGRTRGTGEDFRTWLSKTWARIINVRDAQAYADHVAAGTGVDWIEGQRYSDPRRIAVYFDKHAGYHEKDYQNVMPQFWVDAVAAGEPGATFWGYWGLSKLVEEVELEGEILASARHEHRGAPVAPGLESELARRRHAQPQNLLPDVEGNWHYVSGETEETDDQLRDVPRKYEQSAQAVVVMRHLRRLAKSRAYVRQVEVYRTTWQNHEVDYIDPVTGELTVGWAKKTRKRRVSRKFSYLRNQTYGYLAVNDGAATARDIARLLGGNPPPIETSRRSLLDLAA